MIVLLNLNHQKYGTVKQSIENENCQRPAVFRRDIRYLGQHGIT